MAKKNAKKSMSKKTMKKTKGGFDVFMPDGGAKLGVENPTRVPAANLGAGKVNVGDAYGSVHPT